MVRKTWTASPSVRVWPTSRFQKKKNLVPATMNESGVSQQSTVSLF